MVHCVFKLIRRGLSAFHSQFAAVHQLLPHLIFYEESSLLFLAWTTLPISGYSIRINNLNPESFINSKLSFLPKFHKIYSYSFLLHWSTTLSSLTRAYYYYPHVGAPSSWKMNNFAVVFFYFFPPYVPMYCCRLIIMMRVVHPSSSYKYTKESEEPSTFRSCCLILKGIYWKTEIHSPPSLTFPIFPLNRPHPWQCLWLMQKPSCLPQLHKRPRRHHQQRLVAVGM